MGAVDDAAGKVTDSLLAQGPIGILALIGWMCVIVLGVVIMAVWRAYRASEAARIKDLQDAVESAEKERADMDRKMDILQAVLEAKR